MRTEHCRLTNPASLRGAAWRRINAFAISVLFLCVFASTALCQQRSIVIKVINAKTGKPIANEHLLIFGGKTERDANDKVQDHRDLRTDAAGTAQLTFDPNVTGWIQVFMDGLTPCYNANSVAFSLEKAARTGESTPNCNAAESKNIPGTLTVFAREATLWEKMQW